MKKTILFLLIFSSANAFAQNENLLTQLVQEKKFELTANSSHNSKICPNQLSVNIESKDSTNYVVFSGLAQIPMNNINEGTVRSRSFDHYTKSPIITKQYTVETEQRAFHSSHEIEYYGLLSKFQSKINVYPVIRFKQYDITDKVEVLKTEDGFKIIKSTAYNDVHISTGSTCAYRKI